MAKPLPPMHPGEILLHDFIEPMGITRYRLSRDIGVPPQRIGDIVAGKRAITADTDLRLCRYFGLSDGYWLRGQFSMKNWPSVVTSDDLPAHGCSGSRSARNHPLHEQAMGR